VDSPLHWEGNFHLKYLEDDLVHLVDDLLRLEDNLVHLGDSLVHLVDNLLHLEDSLVHLVDKHLLEDCEVHLVVVALL